MKSYVEGRDGPCQKCEFSGIRDKTYLVESDSMAWICPNCKAIEKSHVLDRRHPDYIEAEKRADEVFKEMQDRHKAILKKKSKNPPKWLWKWL